MKPKTDTPIVYVLKDPGGRLMESTVHVDNEGAWQSAFDWVSVLDRDFRVKYWKRWEARRRAARRRAARKMGYRIVKCKLVEVKP